MKPCVTARIQFDARPFGPKALQGTVAEIDRGLAKVIDDNGQTWYTDVSILKPIKGRIVVVLL